MAWDSKAQMKAAYGGFLGPEMKRKAAEFSRATPNIKALPEHVSDRKKKRGPAVPDTKKL